MGAVLRLVLFEGLLRGPGEIRSVGRGVSIGNGTEDRLI